MGLAPPSCFISFSACYWVFYSKFLFLKVSVLNKIFVTLSVLPNILITESSCVLAFVFLYTHHGLPGSKYQFCRQCLFKLWPSWLIHYLPRLTEVKLVPPHTFRYFHQSIVFWLNPDSHCPPGSAVKPFSQCDDDILQLMPGTLRTQKY